ncbi:MAG TPA: VOC family protein [Dehalococcoidia bacterium]|nr:VOC family protein [Dehalococcoidia bacterium]
MVSPKPDDFPRVTPYLYYEDVNAAFDWLIKAFGFTEKFRMPGPDGVLRHAELNVGDDGVIMIGNPGPGYRKPASVHAMQYIYVDNVDEHYERAKAAGANITQEPADQFYGDRTYAATDPEGQAWYFATCVREVSGEEIAQAAQVS